MLGHDHVCPDIETELLSSPINRLDQPLAASILAQKRPPAKARKCEGMGMAGGVVPFTSSTWLHANNSEIPNVRHNAGGMHLNTLLHSKTTAQTTRMQGAGAIPTSLRGYADVHSVGVACPQLCGMGAVELVEACPRKAVGMAPCVPFSLLQLLRFAHRPIECG